MRFGVDLDGVVYDWVGVALFLLNERWGYNIKREEVRTWDWNLDLKVDPSHWNWLWTAGVREHGLFRHGSVVRGAVEALRELHFKNEVEIVILTARPKAAAVDTLSWLAHHRIPATEIHIMDGGLSKDKKKKSSIACDLYVDDRTKNVEELIENTTSPVILFEAPYNEREALVYKTSKNRLRPLRMKSWAEIKEFAIALTKLERSSG